MDVAFYLGTLAIHWYGILIALAVVAALGIAFIEARRRGEATAHVINLALIVVPLGAIGARLYHVIDKWDYYMQNPEMIIGGRGLGLDDVADELYPPGQRQRGFGPPPG